MQTLDAAYPAGRDGGYDPGYEACRCFWGTRPSSTLIELAKSYPLRNIKVLDLGCGEGKDSAWLAGRRCDVIAIELSYKALANAQRLWRGRGVKWIQADVAEINLPVCRFDLVIAYGLLHCLTEPQISSVVNNVQQATRPGGFNVIATFNSRYQDLSGHPGFAPTLLPHEHFVQYYQTNDWRILISSDTDLTEKHPHNMIEHTHSLTRLAARKMTE